MIITKKRIRNLSSLGFVKNDEVVRFGVSDIDRFIDKCNRIGFESDLEIGESILPDKIGAVTIRNAEGQYVSERDKKKETVYYPRYWTRTQWAGGGQTEEVSNTVYLSVDRFPRKFIAPQSVELIISEDQKGNKLILSPEIRMTDENEKLIVHTVNLILEIFGECQIFQEDLELITVPEIRRFSWELLPVGNYPWDKVKALIEPFISRAKGGNRNLVYDRIEKLHNYKPNFKAYGKAGFSGYIVFGYEDKGIFVLESIYTNNATYVFKNDWEEFSKLSKAEILNNNFQEDRIIHTKNWDDEIKQLLS